MRRPTVFIAADQLGESVLARIRHSLPKDASDLRYIGVVPSAQVDQTLDATLDELLRAGSVAGDQQDPRLDLFAFADLRRGGAPDLAKLCKQAASVVGRRYGVLFRTKADPTQRTAALHLVVVVPALVEQPETAEALRHLAAVERLAFDAADYPLLARIWITSLHTTSGTLTEEGMLASIAAFAVAAVNLRDSDQKMADRLSHLAPGEGKAAFFSVASLSVPEAKLRRYASARAAYEGLSTLVARATREDTDAHAGAQAVSSLSDGKWLTSFEDGEAAERCRKLAASFSDAGSKLPDLTPIGPFDDAAHIRSKYAVLFQKGAVERARTGGDSAELHAMLSALDRGESEAAATIARELASLLDDTLGPSQGLRRLPQVKVGLSRIAARMSDGLAADRAEAERGPLERGAPAAPADLYLAELEEAMAALPSNGMLWAASIATGFGAGAVAAMAALRLIMPASNPAGAGLPKIVLAPGAAGQAASPFVWAQLVPWIAALIVGGVVAYFWAKIAGSRARSRVRELLRQRREALAQLWREGGGGLPRLQADAQLRLRRRRVRRAALRGVKRLLERLEAVTRTLIDMRDRSRQALHDVGVKAPAASAADDDLEALMVSAEASYLHGPLVPPRLLAAWVARRRAVQEPENWADRLLEDGRPPRGLGDDVPCADHTRIDELCQKQTAPLEEENMFAEPAIGEAAGKAVAAFAQRVVWALAAPCVPLDEHGDSATGLRAGQMFAVAPSAARLHIEPALPDSITPLWVNSRAARVLFIRTWEGYSIDSVRRGARIAPSPSSPKAPS